MNANSTVTITFLIAVLGFLFTAYNFYSARKKDAIESAARLEEIRESLLKCNMKLDTVCATTNETRSDIKAMNVQIQALDKELGLVKADVKTAFRRIESLEEQHNG